MNEFSRIFKNYKFMALWASQILSQLSINILSFLVMIHLFDQTGSTVASSLLWITYAVPAIIFGPVAPAAVDLMEKRKALMITNLSQSIIIFLFAALLYKNLFYLSYIVVFTYSLLNQFYVPSEAATLPHIVKEQDLPTANGLFFVTQQSSLVLGFATAGILDQVLGFRPTLILMGLCLFLAFISVTFLPKFKPDNKLPVSFEKRFSKFFEQIIEGYNFIKNNHKILFPFLLLLGVQVILAVIVVNLPGLATGILHIATGSSGLIVVVPAGVGAIIGTLFIPKLLRKGIYKRHIVLPSLILLGVATTCVAIIVPIIPIGLIRIIVGVFFFVLTGLGAVGTLVPSMTYLQEHTPKDLLGRVFGNFWFLTTLATVIPVLFSATITDLFGIQFLLLLLGGATLIVTIFSSLKVNEI
jgi:MFS family permease